MSFPLALAYLLGGPFTSALTSAFAEEHQDLLIQQHQVPVQRAMVRALAFPIGEVVDAADAIRVALDLELASGISLDRLGRIVRERRGGRTDDAYRNAIRVRILINRSNGSRDELAAIARLFELVGDGIVRVVESRARVVVAILAEPVNPPGAVHVRLRQARAAGVAHQTITLPNGNETTYFRLGRAADYPEAELDFGLGYTGDPTLGGALGHVRD